MTDSRQDVSDAPSGEVRPPRVLLVGVVGAVLLWLSHPPAGLWPLGWVAPACWLWLAESPAKFGRREYLRVWLAGSLYWLLAVHWVRLPHPLTPLGWPLLAMYLGCYPVATVALVRAARRRWRAPLWLAAPVAWTGMELVQARLFTGFLMGAVSHSQAGQPWVRSIAAYAGAYGVTFVVVLVAATLTAAFIGRRGDRRLQDALRVVAAVVLVVVLGWAARVATPISPADGPRPRVALIQGDTRATWDADPQRGQKIMDAQMRLSVAAHRQAQGEGGAVDLVVWPESMFRSPLYTFEGSLNPPTDADDSQLEIAETTRGWFELLASVVGDAPVLVGIDRFDWRTDDEGIAMPDVYNSVALADGDGKVAAYYDKTHRVPFGEYIPFASNLPALYYLTPMSGGLHPGDGPVALDALLRDGGVLRLCPSVCYESVVPHVIRRQVAELTDRGERPDALVNVTNDAWFWGSSELDMHLACGVYRAIENGLPLLVAANGGLSAVVDAKGEVLQVSPRMTEHVLLADVPPRVASPTFYAQWGDLFAGACLVACAALVGWECVGKYRRRQLSGRATEGTPGAGDAS